MVPFHLIELAWQRIQHLLPGNIFHLQESQGNLSLQVCASATQQLCHALVEAPHFKSLVFFSTCEHICNATAAHMQLYSELSFTVCLLQSTANFI